MRSLALVTEEFGPIPLRLRQAMRRSAHRSWLRRLLVLFLVLAIEGSALGEVCAPGVELRRAIVQYQGQSGMWFNMEVARCLLDDASALPLVRQRVTLLEEKIQLQDERAVFLREAISLGDQATQRAVGALARSERLRLTAEETARGAQQATRLWTVVGFAGGVLIVVLAAWAWHAVSTS